MGLLTTASVAMDGSKFKAVNNRDKEFHAREGGAAARAVRRERCALSKTARHRRTMRQGCLQAQIGKLCSKRSGRIASGRSRSAETPSSALSHGQDPELTSASDARRYVPMRAVIVTANAMRRLRTGRSTLSRHHRTSTPMVPPLSTHPVVIPSDDTDMDSFSISSGRRHVRPRSASND